MKHAVVTLLLGSLLLAGNVRAAAQVHVAFIEPSRYTDAADLWVGDADNLLTISRHLQKLGSKYLALGQTLKIEVLDIDLAGRARPTRSLYVTRVVSRVTDWPRITLRYALEADGRVLQSGQDSISDMAFYSHITSSAWQPLHYEKRMLTDWFRDHFAAKSAP